MPLENSFSALFTEPGHDESSFSIFSASGSFLRQLGNKRKEELILSTVTNPSRDSIFFVSHRDPTPCLSFGRLTLNGTMAYWPAPEGCELLEIWDAFPNVITAFVDEGTYRVVLRVITRPDLVEYRVDLESGRVSCVVFGTEKEGLGTSPKVEEPTPTVFRTPAAP